VILLLAVSGYAEDPTLFLDKQGIIHMIAHGTMHSLSRLHDDPNLLRIAVARYVDVFVSGTFPDGHVVLRRVRYIYICVCVGELPPAPTFNVRTRSCLFPSCLRAFRSSPLPAFFLSSPLPAWLPVCLRACPNTC
jgi:hypothetical protein